MGKSKYFELSFKGRRDSNQDSVCHYEIGGYRFIAVADGMGGYKGGKIASNTAIQTAKNILNKAITENRKPNLKKILRHIYRITDDEIKKLTAENPSYEGMGTTLSCILLTPEGEYVFGSVGDSRIYLFDGDEFNQITQDHTYVQQYINDFGYPVPEEILKSSNVLLKALDGKGDEPDIFPIEHDSFQLNEGTVFLLCSDGLIPEKDVDLGEHFKRYLIGSRSLRITAEQLIAYSFHSGMKDNITVLLASYGRIQRKKLGLQSFVYPPSDVNPEEILLADKEHSAFEAPKHRKIIQMLAVLLVIAISVWLLRIHLVEYVDKLKLNKEQIEWLDAADFKIDNNEYMDASLSIKQVLDRDPDNRYVNKKLRSVLDSAFENEFEKGEYNSVVDLGRVFKTKIENNFQSRFYYAKSLKEVGETEYLLPELLWLHNNWSTSKNISYNKLDLIEDIAFVYAASMKIKDATHFFRNLFIQTNYEANLEYYLRFLNAFYFSPVQFIIDQLLQNGMNNEEMLELFQHLNTIQNDGLRVDYVFFPVIDLNYFEEMWANLNRDYTLTSFYVFKKENINKGRYHSIFNESSLYISKFNMYEHSNLNHFKNALISDAENPVYWERLNAHLRQYYHEYISLLLYEIVRKKFESDKGFQNLEQFFEQIIDHDTVEYIFLEYDEKQLLVVSVDKHNSFKKWQDSIKSEEEVQQHLFINHKFIHVYSHSLFKDNIRMGILRIGLGDDL